MAKWSLVHQSIALAVHEFANYTRPTSPGNGEVSASRGKADLTRTAVTSESDHLGLPDELTRPPWSDSVKSRLESFTAAIPIPQGWRAPCLLHGCSPCRTSAPGPSLRFTAMQWFVCYCCTPMAIETALIALRRPTPSHRVGNEVFGTTQNRQRESE
jgi:hypothetical protein